MKTRKTVGSLPAILVFGLGWASFAQAGCGDAHAIAGSRAVVHLDLLSRVSDLPVPAKAADLSMPIPRCVGLSCSKGSPAAHDAAPSVAPASDQWGHLGGLVLGAEISSSPSLRDEPSALPRHRGTSPFRPPR